MREHARALPYLILTTFLLAACLGTPTDVEPVRDFDLERYLGTWYEIARLDHRFERGLEQITAEYSLREDGGIRVLNRGYDPEKSEWREAEGRAYRRGEEDVAALKVSFFGPFYAAYNVILLDSDYRWALVSGHNHDYLWILSRTPQLDAKTLQSIRAKARAFGFPVDEMLTVRHQPSAP